MESEPDPRRQLASFAAIDESNRPRRRRPGAATTPGNAWPGGSPVRGDCQRAGGQHRPGDRRDHTDRAMPAHPAHPEAGTDPIRRDRTG